MSGSIHLGVVAWTLGAERLMEESGTHLSDLLDRHAAGLDSRDDGVSRISVFEVEPARAAREEIDGSVYIVTNRVEGYTVVCLPQEY